jgi:hypothetical protein
MSDTARRSFLQGILAAGAIPAVPASAPKQPSEASDWLLNTRKFPAKIIRTSEKEIALSNGLVSRVFRTAPNLATVALDDVVNNQSLLRSVRPEATIKVNGNEMAIGGLVGQPIHNYLLPEWLDSMTADPRAFRFVRSEEDRTVARFPWKKHPEWLTEDLAWPPPGVALTLHFEAGPQTAVHDSWCGFTMSFTTAFP